MEWTTAGGLSVRGWGVVDVFGDGPGRPAVPTEEPTFVEVERRLSKALLFVVAVLVSWPKGVAAFVATA